VKRALAEADGSALQRRLEADGFIEVAGERLTAADVEVRADRHEEFALADDGGWAVALDLELDDDLRREGLARELVRSLNDLRKDVRLDIADRVVLGAGGRVDPGPGRRCPRAARRRPRRRRHHRRGLAMA
jgi:isoleucyl-tRNA synthetase